MTLNAQTKIGLTFGQIISIVTTTAIVVGFYFSLSLQINELRDRISEHDRQITTIENNMERIRVENREDHAAVNSKLDVLILKFNK